MSQQRQESGSVIFSVDIPDQGVTKAQVRELFQLFDSRGLPATWAAGRMHARQVSYCVRESQSGHEVAILGNADWLPVDNNRRTFYRTLVERMQQFRDERVPVTTLAMDNVELVEHLDLLVKHRISMFRCTSTTAATAARCLQPRSLRFGVWQAPAALRLSARHRAGWWTDMKLRRAIRQCSRKGGVVHLLAQADELLEHQGHWRLLDGLLRNVADRTRNDSLQCITLQQLSRQIQRRPLRTTSQSLLHRAA